MRGLPARQQSAHASITEPLFFVFVALLVQRQGFVIDESARASKASQVAKLLATRHGFELVALHPEHGSIVVGLWQDIQDICHGGQRAFAMHVHLVFITKYGHRVFDGDAIKRLRGLFSELAQRHIHISRGMLREQRPDLTARYGKDVLWSPSYFAASCGVHLATF